MPINFGPSFNTMPQMLPPSGRSGGFQTSGHDNPNDPMARRLNRQFPRMVTSHPGGEFGPEGPMGFVQSHGGNSGAPPTARRRVGGAGGVVDPSYRMMMNMKAGEPTRDRLSAQGFKPQTPSPGMFPGLSPSIFYQNFDEQGRVRQPQQQQNPYGMMGPQMFNPYMSMGGYGGGMMNFGPSDQMMRQFNMGGFGGGIWNPVYSGGPDTSQMMGQMRNRGMGGGLFGRMGY